MFEMCMLPLASLLLLISFAGARFSTEEHLSDQPPPAASAHSAHALLDRTARQHLLSHIIKLQVSYCIVRHGSVSMHPLSMARSQEDDAAWMLPRRNRKLGISYVGDLARLRCSLNKIITGRPFVLSMTGGSVTEGNGGTLMNPSWPVKLHEFIQQLFLGQAQMFHPFRPTPLSSCFFLPMIREQKHHTSEWGARCHKQRVHVALPGGARAEGRRRERHAARLTAAPV